MGGNWGRGKSSVSETRTLVVDHFESLLCLCLLSDGHDRVLPIRWLDVVVEFVLCLECFDLVAFSEHHLYYEHLPSSLDALRAALICDVSVRFRR